VFLELIAAADVVTAEAVETFGFMLEENLGPAFLACSSTSCCFTCANTISNGAF